MFKFFKEKSFYKGITIGVITAGIGALAIGAYADNVLKSIQVAVNSVKITVNGSPANSDNFVYDGRTYVQLRDVTTMLGKEIGWDAKTKTVSITDNGNSGSQSSKPFDISSLKLLQGYYQYSTDENQYSFIMKFDSMGESISGTAVDVDENGFAAFTGTITKTSEKAGQISFQKTYSDYSVNYVGDYTISGTKIEVKGKWSSTGSNLEGTFYLSNQ